MIVVDLEDGTETTLESEAETLTVLGLMPGTFYQFSVVSIGALGVTNINRSVLATTQTGDFFNLIKELICNLIFFSLITAVHNKSRST